MARGCKEMRKKVDGVSIIVSDLTGPMPFITIILKNAMFLIGYHATTRTG
jgi:hypothetical protein